MTGSTVGEGRIGPHPVFPDAQGPAARRIDGEEDIQDVIALLRLNYDRLAASQPHGGRR
ncbi:MAG TPA: luciferase family protein [Solirubrobacteraceae bacterium]|nr:luciferase family protein [Solirubrobacteraceae bacterium]